MSRLPFIELGTAEELQVLLIVLSAFRFRDDVIDGHIDEGEEHPASAPFA